MDWERWHDDYDRPGTVIAKRLTVVQAQIAAALDEAPIGPIRLVSLCAGQGHDLLGVLPDHPRCDDVTARLVELDPRNVAKARERVTEAGLDNVDIRQGDATLSSHYVDLVPAEIVLACGVFGNLSDDNVERAIANLPKLCAPNAEVIWTAGRTIPGLFDLATRTFANHGFEERFLSDPAETYGVGWHTFRGTPQPLDPDASLFTFTGREV